MTLEDIMLDIHRQFSIEELVAIRADNQVFYDELAKRYPKYKEHIYPITKQRAFIVLPFISMQIMGEFGVPASEDDLFEMYETERVYNTLEYNDSEECYQHIHNGAFDVLTSFYMNTQLVLHHAIQVVNYLLENQKGEVAYKVWLKAYQILEYSHAELLSLRDKVKDYAPTHDDSLKPPFKVYRGATNESTPYKEAMSWTTKKEIASRFACRYSSTMHYIVEATLPDGVPFDAIGFGDVSVISEAEILVDGSQLTDIKIYKVPHVKEFLDYMSGGILEHTDLPLLSIYEELKYLLKQDVARNKGAAELSDHDITHTLRVFLNALNLAHVNDLSSEQISVLMACAYHHDRKRTHDGEDDKHGRRAVSLVEKDRGVFHIILPTPSHVEQVKFIVEYHCIDDERAYKALSHKISSDMREDTWLLYQIFKDADALDRLRFNGLDPSYLRNMYSLAMVANARDFLKYIKA